VHIYADDCKEILKERVFPLARYQDRKRALCLLDPYNIDLSWEVVGSSGCRVGRMRDHIEIKRAVESGRRLISDMRSAGLITSLLLGQQSHRR
jgi:hypothetical protein